MRRLSDNHKIPREAQSYIIDSTGAPVCALLPFSTWAVFFAGLFYAEAGIPELGYGSAIDTFYHIICHHLLCLCHAAGHDRHRNRQLCH